MIHMVNFIAVTLALFVQWSLDYYLASLANQLEQMSKGDQKYDETNLTYLKVAFADGIM